MLLSFALKVWYSKYVQAAVQLFIEKIWPKIDKPVLKFWNEQVLPLYISAKNTYFRIKKFINWVKIFTKKAFFFLIWMLSSLQNTITTVKFVFVYLASFLKFKKIQDRNYFVNFLIFYIKNSTKHFYFFKWSFLNFISYIIFNLADLLNKHVFKNKIFDASIPFSTQSPFVYWVFFNFFKKGNYLSKLKIFKKSDFSKLKLNRRYSKIFPRYFSIAHKHSILKQRSEFGKVSINSLKYTYCDFSENVVRLPEILEPSGVYKESSKFTGKRLTILITFLFFYRFSVKKPTVLFNFIKFHLYFNMITKSGKEVPILPSVFFRDLVLEDDGDIFMNKLLDYTIFMTCAPKVIRKPLVYAPINSTYFWDQILSKKTPIFNRHLIHITFKSEILEELLKIRLKRLYNNASRYKVFYTNTSFYFTKYYEYFVNVTNPIFYKTNSSSGAAEIYYGSSYHAQMLSNYPVKVKSSFVRFLGKYWPTRFNPSNFYKFNDLIENKDNVNMFLRKNKIFNKSRYSRNRQIYRTGVYLCLYINVIFVYFYVFAFYRFAFVFGYLWLGIGLFIISMTLGRAMKYRFYNPVNFYTEFLNFLGWFSFLIYDGWVALKKFSKKHAGILRSRFIIILKLDDIFPVREKSKNSAEKKKLNLWKFRIKCRKYFGFKRQYLLGMALNTPEDYKSLWFIIRPRTLRLKLKQRFFFKRNIIRQKFLNFTFSDIKLYWGRG